MAKLAVLLLPGGLLFAAVWFALERWCRRCDRRERAELALAIRPPRYIFETADEKLRERTDQRRQAAANIRARAARVESGTRMTDVLRMVRQCATARSLQPVVTKHTSRFR